jgi:hypothetical protein
MREPDGEHPGDRPIQGSDRGLRRMIHYEQAGVRVYNFLTILCNNTTGAQPIDSRESA